MDIECKQIFFFKKEQSLLLFRSTLVLISSIKHVIHLIIINDCKSMNFPTIRHNFMQKTFREVFNRLLNT